MDIGSKIKLIRKELDLTQAAFAERIGLKQAVIGLYENNQRNVVDRVISDICREFNVNEVWLRTGEGKMFVDSETISLDDYAQKHNMSDLDFRIIEAYLSLDENVRENIIEKFKATLNNTNDSEIATSKEDDIEKEVQAFKTELEAEKR